MLINDLLINLHLCIWETLLFKAIYTGLKVDILSVILPYENLLEMNIEQKLKQLHYLK